MKEPEKYVIPPRQTIMDKAVVKLAFDHGDVRATRHISDRGKGHHRPALMVEFSDDTAWLLWAPSGTVYAQRMIRLED